MNIPEAPIDHGTHMEVPIEIYTTDSDTYPEHVAHKYPLFFRLKVKSKAHLETIFCACEEKLAWGVGNTVWFATVMADSVHGEYQGGKMIRISEGDYLKIKTFIDNYPFSLPTAEDFKAKLERETPKTHKVVNAIMELGI